MPRTDAVARPLLTSALFVFVQITAPRAQVTVAVLKLRATSF